LEHLAASFDALAPTQSTGCAADGPLTQSRPLRPVQALAAASQCLGQRRSASGCGSAPGAPQARHCCTASNIVLKSCTGHHCRFRTAACHSLHTCGCDCCCWFACWLASASRHGTRSFATICQLRTRRPSSSYIAAELPGNTSRPRTRVGWACSAPAASLHALRPASRARAACPPRHMSPGLGCGRCPGGGGSGRGLGDGAGGA
jgi:hypothetical protein